MRSVRDGLGMMEMEMMEDFYLISVKSRGKERGLGKNMAASVWLGCKRGFRTMI